MERGGVGGCVPAHWAAVQTELSAVLNQHRLQSVSTFTSYLTFSFWKTKAPRGAAANLTDLCQLAVSLNDDLENHPHFTAS